ncbi:hypothetical protein MWU75_09570 [Ornithinimicrobium sp. F0845]|uniref:hypothetical protein n=1 Tax=Ornithinimicrobium sp. F0845 TaxID=2926412 RepID=UPI001FF3E938|nr:hypothetical protein [Ornithinimicrobium sp. F0845]MCK0112384.1 hypothetical protein [Ornithinimicrobium sp. F0845]
MASAGILCLALSACSGAPGDVDVVAGEHDRVPTPRATEGSIQTPQSEETGDDGSAEFSRVKMYTSLKEMAHDSSTIGIFQSTGEINYDTIAGSAIAVVTLELAEPIAGERPEQVRVATFAHDESGSLLLGEPGEYLLFLKPWVIRGEQVSERWLATDDWSGIYTSGNSGGSWVRYDSEATELPESVSIGELDDLSTRSTPEIVAEVVEDQTGRSQR